MTTKFRYADLARFLESQGYVCHLGRRPEDATYPGPERFHLWEHPDHPKARIILPEFKPDDTIMPYHLLAAGGTLIHHGLMTRDDFDRWRLGLTRAQADENGVNREARPRKSRAADGGRKKT
jgi:hypothetical protein